MAITPRINQPDLPRLATGDCACGYTNASVNRYFIFISYISAIYIVYIGCAPKYNFYV